MEDLITKILSLEEIERKFTQEEIERVIKRNYVYSTELLKDRLSNARILYSNSTRNFFSILTVGFAAIAIIMSLWIFNQNFETTLEFFKIISSLGIFISSILLGSLVYKLTRYFGTDFRDAELEMQIIPFILDDRSRNEEINEE